MCRSDVHAVEEMDSSSSVEFIKQYHIHAVTDKVAPSEWWENVSID